MFAAKTRAVRDPGWNQWAKDLSPTPGASPVSADSATQMLTVYGCVTRIADVMSTMAVDHFTRRGGVQEEMSQRAAWLDQPNPDVDWSAFMTQVIWSLLIDGNLFLMPIRSAGGRVIEVWVLDPTVVRLERLQAGGPVSVYVNGRPFAGELVHVPAYLRPGAVRGMNPIDNARTAIGLGLSAQQYGASFFDNSGVPAVVIKAKGELTPQQAKDIKEGWSLNHRGAAKAGGIGVLGGDAEIHTLTISPEHAQFLETRRFSAAEIAANLFHVPPDMVGVAIEGSSLTYQNMETRWTEFIRSACQPWMTRLERAMSWNLLPRPQFIKFVPDVYLRADTKTRYETHRLGVAGGFLTPNEARRLEDLPEIPGADGLTTASATTPTDPAAGTTP